MKLLRKDEYDTQRVFQAVLDWLDTQTGWLFIYDNLEASPRKAPGGQRTIRGTY